jgi:sugar phosphate isomerase/epimerase
MTSTSRRNFLLSSVAAGAAASASRLSGVVTTPENPPKKLKISVLCYSFHGLLKEGKMDIFGYLETCKYRYRLDAADIWNGFLASTEEGYLKNVREALDERELALADLAVDGAVVWDDSPEVREKNHKNALAHLKAAEILGARFMRVDAGGSGGSWTEEQFDHIVRCYKEYAQWAYDHGFKTGAESHFGPEKVWANMQKLYRAVDHPGFGVSCHIGGWAGSEADIAAADREVAPWVCHTHIDWKTTGGPLEEKLANLWNVGYQGYYSVEHHSGKDEYVEVAIQLARVREVLEQFRDGQSTLV